MVAHTADEWRNGTNLRGETYHLWLKELAETYSMEISTIARFYQEITKCYREENNMEGDKHLKNKDYPEINDRVEKAVETLATFQFKSPRITKSKELSFNFRKFLEYVSFRRYREKEV